jgi:hypothetical protein
MMPRKPKTDVSVLGAHKSLDPRPITSAPSGLQPPVACPTGRRRLPVFRSFVLACKKKKCQNLALFQPRINKLRSKSAKLQPRTPLLLSLRPALQSARKPLFFRSRIVRSPLAPYRKRPLARSEKSGLGKEESNDRS